MSKGQAVIAALVSVGILGFAAKAARHLDQVQLAIGPTARGIAEELRAADLPKGEAVTAAQAVAQSRKEDTD